MFLLPFIIAQEKPAPSRSPFGGLFMIIMLLFFGIIILPQIMQQRRQRRAHGEMLRNLGTGDKVMTTGGLMGLITNVKEDTLTVKIADNVKVEVSRSHIARLVDKSTEERGEN